MERSGWGAQPPKKDDMDPFKGPVDYLIVSHTATIGRCFTNDDCCAMVRHVQDLNIAPPPDGSGVIYICYESPT